MGHSSPRRSRSGRHHFRPRRGRNGNHHRFFGANERSEPFNSSHPRWRIRGCARLAQQTGLEYYPTDRQEEKRKTRKANKNGQNLAKRQSAFCTELSETQKTLEKRI